MTKISKEFYDYGFKLDGERNRIDIINPYNEKVCEIFFFENGVLIMSREHVWTAKGILGIYPGPRIECF